MDELDLLQKIEELGWIVEHYEEHLDQERISPIDRHQQQEPYSVPLMSQLRKRSVSPTKRYPPWDFNAQEHIILQVRGMTCQVS